MEKVVVQIDAEPPSLWLPALLSVLVITTSLDEETSPAARLRIGAPDIALALTRAQPYRPHHSNKLTTKLSSKN